MSDGSLGPGAQAVVVFVALTTFALVTTAAVVAVGVGPVTDAVPASSESVPDQPGAVVDDDDDRTGNVTGVVRAPGGSSAANASVVLAPSPEPLFEKATPSELAAVVDDETSTTLHVTETGANGSFRLQVPAGEYDVVALRDGNVSAVRTVNASASGDPAAVDLALRADRPLTYEARGTEVAPGGNATVTVAAYNRNDDPASLSVSYFEAPAGWTVVDYRGSAVRVNETTRTFHFADVPAGDWARAELVVRAPANATPGDSVRFGASASAPEPGPGDEVVVTWRGSATVTVPGTDTATGTRTPGDAGDDGAGGSTTEDDATTTGLGLVERTVPGFGLALALAATTLVVAAFAARQQA
ncbi:carboxypeptidase-like regulatory domain-containing protein [Halorubellus litoreus]|uniref:Carboxypeptidase-like regulatory domain-containing protein n=1 Tax=Halorubellus litoreus TaxID=755308 RepID=A0ABD5V8A9_9EURY